MSKNGSRSALKYLGNSWGLSKSHRSNPSIFTVKSQEARKKEQDRKAKQLEKRQRLREQYNRLCNQFAIRNRKDDPYLQIIKGKFCGLKSEKDRQTIVDNVEHFKLYCKHYSETFNLHRYYNLEWYRIDFKKEYPEIFSSTTLGDFKVVASGTDKNNTLRNNLSQDVFTKLLTLKHKLRK